MRNDREDISKAYLVEHLPEMVISNLLKYEVLISVRDGSYQFLRPPESEEASKKQIINENAQARFSPRSYLRLVNPLGTGRP